MSASPAAVQAAELSRGPFVSYEHQSTGTARLLRLADGSLLVRLEDLSSPTVLTYVSGSPIVWPPRPPTRRGGRWLELGPLRANRGDLNYPVAAGTDLSEIAASSSGAAASRSLSQRHRSPLPDRAGQCPTTRTSIRAHDRSA